MSEIANLGSIIIVSLVFLEVALLCTIVGLRFMRLGRFKRLLRQVRLVDRLATQHVDVLAPYFL